MEKLLIFVRMYSFLLRRSTILLFIAGFGLAQAQQNATEAVHLANEALQHKNYSEAISLLEPYDDSAEALQLLAQTYYWDGQIDKAHTTFQKGMERFPKTSSFWLQYGVMLYEQGEERGAISTIAEFLTADSSHTEANLMMGYLAFQQERYGAAQQYFRTILLQQPAHEQARAMLQAIYDRQAWHLQVGATHHSDNQPLRRLSPYAELRKYYSPWWFPRIQAKAWNLDTDTLQTQAGWIRLGNQFTFSKAGLVVRLSAGLFLDQVDGSSHWVGSGSMEKRLSSKLSVVGKWQHRPIFFTAASAVKLITTDEYTLGIHLEQGDGLMGRAVFAYTDYFDDNRGWTAYAWLLSPALKWKISKWRIGYVFAFSDTAEGRFTPRSSLDEILQNYQEGMQINGVYDPYFTPLDQQVHAVLGQATLQLHQSVALKLSGTVSFYAAADIPVFYLDDTSSGVDIVQSSFRQKSTNLELKAELNTAISKRFSLNTYYQYTDNFFYRAHTFNVQLNWWFLSEK